VHAYAQETKITQQDKPSRHASGWQAERSRLSDAQNEPVEPSVPDLCFSYNFSSMPLHSNARGGVMLSLRLQRACACGASSDKYQQHPGAQTGTVDSRSSASRYEGARQPQPSRIAPNPFQRLGVPGNSSIRDVPIQVYFALEAPGRPLDPETRQYALTKPRWRPRCSTISTRSITWRRRS
jgi:hypothetical protein